MLNVSLYIAEAAVKSHCLAKCQIEIACMNEPLAKSFHCIHGSEDCAKDSSDDLKEG